MAHTVAADLPNVLTPDLGRQRNTNDSWPSASSGSTAPSESDLREVTQAPRAGSLARKQKQMRRQEKLKEFLKKNGFSEDVTEPRMGGGCWFYKKETVWPIHLAAAEGNAELVRMLMMQGAEVEQPSSKGRTAKDFARKRGHQKVLDLLESEVKVVGLRKAMELMSSDGSGKDAPSIEID
ncbi:unnamed protein product [Durusdinium trenchii]|uniref:Ankyrin repeat protein n=1 Tax=Durusdinium trenchii TaxID=1381693 RepID=A0ABP0N498_9DINO